LLKTEFPEVDAQIRPGAEIRTAKVYFRSDKYPDFYYVEMKGTAHKFIGLLPMPGPETERIIYYIEAVDNGFNGARSEEYDPPVDDRCKRRAPAGWTGENPGIVVGATKAGAPAIPPGFQAAGIVGFITSAGVSTGVGGGVGVGTAVAAGAAAAAGGVVVASAAGGSQTTTVISEAAVTTSSTPSTAPTTTLGSSSTTSVAPGASTTTSSAPPGSTTSTVAGSSTTTVVGGSTTTTVIGGTTTVTTSSTTSSSTTSSTSSTTTSAPAPVTACFDVNVDGDCKISLNASCSSGPIIRYDWVIDVGNVIGRVTRSTGGPTTSQNWGDCDDGTITIQLTVVGSSGQTSSTSLTIFVPGDLRSPLEADEKVATSFVSFLAVTPFDGGGSGSILLNQERLETISNAGPVTHRFLGLQGKNTVEAYLASESRRGGFWRFDFSGAEHFAPGSIVVEGGQVVAVDAYTVTFRVDKAPGERLKFSYELNR
jgi:hypothetical protein